MGGCALSGCIFFSSRASAEEEDHVEIEYVPPPTIYMI